MRGEKHTEPIKISLDGKDFLFRILSALEFDTVMDNADTQNLANRRLVSASTGISEDELGTMDRPTYGRLLVEFHRLHAPKGVSELFKGSTTSPRR